MKERSRTGWVFAITSIALFMAALDNLVVSTALPRIQADLGASIQQLEWIVNAYTLTFAVLLLTGAALGDRFGRRRVFIVGLALFTTGSALAAISPTTDALIVARAFQGIGGAIVTPLTLTILSAAVPPERRGLALGGWGAVGGLAVALGPLVGGAIVEGASWHWIFWINVPIGLVAIPLAIARLPESFGPRTSLDLPGLGLASAGLLGLVWGLIHGNSDGWTSPAIVAALAGGAALLVAFVAWEARASAPMVPMRLFRVRAFSAVNAVSLLMSFGVFGVVFLLSQFFQVVQGYSPLQAGLRTLPWTAMPLIVAPVAGVLVDRVGGRALLVAGMTLMAAGLAWIAATVSPTVPYAAIVPGLVLSGIGMGLFFAPTAAVVLGAVRRDEEGKASGVNNTIREIGGVFGVAILASVFTANGGYGSPETFVAGLAPAMWVGAAVVAVGALAALAVPGRRAALPSLAVPHPEVRPAGLVLEPVEVRTDR